MLAKIGKHTNARVFLSCSEESYPERARQLSTWLEGVLAGRSYTTGESIADASLRSYFRVHTEETTFIVMDAPDQSKSLERFMRFSEQLRGIGVEAPAIHAKDEKHGFLLLSDLGTQTYLDVVEETNADRLYHNALDTLCQIQTRASIVGLADYDAAFLLSEMEMFIDWFLALHLGIELSTSERDTFDKSFAFLIDSALEQPRCFVHRDYHSRNLTVTHKDMPGVIDFQDAVAGALTYDLVSLLRDVYVVWPDERVSRWQRYYYDQAMRHKLLPGVDLETFTRWFDLMGAQRHLKIAGIFARLYYRDKKPGYLEDIPAALSYLTAVTDRYAALNGLHRLLETMDVKTRTSKRTREVLS